VTSRRDWEVEKLRGDRKVCGLIPIGAACLLLPFDQPQNERIHRRCRANWNRSLSLVQRVSRAFPRTSRAPSAGGCDGRNSGKQSDAQREQHNGGAKHGRLASESMGKRAKCSNRFSRDRVGSMEAKSEVDIS